MEVRCDKCQARYRVDDARIGPQGLTMRCGKCQNTFRVMRPLAPPSPAPPDAHATMEFAAPAAAAPRPAPPAPPPAPGNDEAAGRTMVFPSAPPAAKKAAESPASGTVVFSQPPRPAPARPAPAAPPPAKEAGEARQSTMIFGGSAGRQPAKPSAPQADEAPRSTMIFGGSPGPQAAKPSGQEAAEAAKSTMIFGGTAGLQGAKPPAQADAGIGAPAPAPAAAEEQSETGEELPAGQPVRRPGPFDKAPPRALLIGVAAGLVLLLATGSGLLAWRRLARHPPPPAAIEMLASAEADAAQDTLASIASAEAKARDALDLAGPRARFPQATATLARVEIQWADALEDEASRIADRSPDDPRVAQLERQARAKAKAAFELLSPAAKADGTSRELQLGLADYYRFQRSFSNMNRYLKPFKDDPHAALIQAMAAAEDVDGAERAISGLKTALPADPRSARVHFRLALAYASIRNEEDARAELRETLRLSPQHERAQVLLQELGTAARPGADRYKDAR